MINEKDTTRISKLMSLVLRHQPQVIGLSLDENGWANTTELLEKMNQHSTSITLAILQHVVATNNKKRFAFNEDGSKIRASQGHSIEVELNLLPQVPPPILYHGTAEKNVSSILVTGLEKRTRNHVHLSSDVPTAITVGKRHGKPAVFEIAAEKMHEKGFLFYCSANKVWLTNHVPANYLQMLSSLPS